MRIIHATGQMCNQFWILSNFIADCKENNKKIAVWLPDFNLEEFKILYNSDLVSFPLFPKVLIDFFGYRKYSKFIKKIFGNRVVLKIAHKLLNIVPGVEFIISDVTCKKSPHKFKYLKDIMNLFYPDEKYISNVNNKFDLYEKSNIVIVGVHIRYGDYRTFMNGKYFYSLEQYNKIMIDIQDIFIERKIHFFIASNEKIDIGLFKDVTCFQIDSSNPSQDLLGLSRCSYICGPPSTYSAWASLYNTVPLYFIEDINTEPLIRSFIDIRTTWF